MKKKIFKMENIEEKMDKETELLDMFGITILSAEDKMSEFQYK